MSTPAEKQRAHDLVERLPEDQISFVVRFMEFMLLDPVSRSLAGAPLEDEEIGEAETQSVARSKKWFEENEGLPFEQVAAEIGLSMERVRGARDPAA